jgi:geranylgeranyl reductase family protein
MKTIGCDVLVVGAGPAGSSAARAAAKAGADVLMLDRRSVVGVPVQCAEYVPAQLVGEIGLDRSYIAQPVAGMKTFLPDGETTLTPAKGFVINRDHFDQALARAAKTEGAALMLETRAVERTPDGAVLARQKGSDAPIAITAKVVIGADGPRSTVGRWVGCVNENLLPGVQVTLPLTEACEHTEVYFDPEIFGGYGWFFPKRDVANIGLGMRRPVDDPCSLSDILDRFAQRFVLAGRVRPEPVATAGGWIPAEPVRSAVRGDVVLVGDAAGQTHPITGAGIFAAVTCGEMAGRVAAEASAAGDPDVLAEYDEEWRDLFEDTLTRASSRHAEMEAGWGDFDAVVRRGWVAFREYYA